MQFTKWHGQGNDFVIVNGLEETFDDYSKTAVIVCDRHFGIGADGLAILLPPTTSDADFRMRIFNSDGSEAEMCGNVTRCMARYAYENGLTNNTKICLETLAGIIVPELIFEDGAIKTIRVNMGKPRLKRAEIPMVGPSNEQAILVPIEINGRNHLLTCVSMGNPHAVIFVDDLSDIDLSAIGPLIETNPLFPRKTNVEFVQVLDRTRLRMRVWERGAGITLACGTGASAVLVAAVLTGRTEKEVEIHLDGGSLYLEWGSDDYIYMSGPAIETFRGVYLGS